MGSDRPHPHRAAVKIQSMMPIEPVLTDRMGATYLPVVVAPVTVLITTHPIFLGIFRRCVSTLAGSGRRMRDLGHLVSTHPASGFLPRRALLPGCRVRGAVVT